MALPSWLGGIGSIFDVATSGYKLGGAIYDALGVNELFEPPAAKRDPYRDPPQPSRTTPSFSQLPTLGISTVGTNPVPMVSPSVHGPTSNGGQMDWGYGNGDFALTTTRSRGLIPYSGGMIPSGYRVANRPGRPATAGYPAGVYLVRRRSMNVLNPRALMRAERRMSGFTRWVKRHFTIAAAAPRRRKVGRKKGCR